MDTEADKRFSILQDMALSDGAIDRNSKTHECYHQASYVGSLTHPTHEHHPTWCMSTTKPRELLRLTHLQAPPHCRPGHDGSNVDCHVDFRRSCEEINQILATFLRDRNEISDASRNMRGHAASVHCAPVSHRIMHCETLHASPGLTLQFEASPQLGPIQLAYGAES